MLLDPWEVMVVDAIDVVYTNNLEDVMDTYVEFHIGHITHLMNDGNTIARGHLEKVVVTGMQSGVVLG